MVGALLGAGGDGAMLLEPIEKPLDAIPLPVCGAVEGGVGRLIAAAWDDGANTPRLQVVPDAAAAVTLVPGNAVRTQARSSPAGAFDRARLQQSR